MPEYNIKNNEAEIEDLTIRIVELENGDRNKRSKRLIESYTSDIEFDELKKLIHSMIERIEITHDKQKKSGFFTLKIIYKYYDEYSIFVTDWQAMTWQWLYHHRGQAMNEEELEQDKELLRYMLESGGKKAGNLKDFKGYKKISSMNDVTILKPDELLRFDTTT